MSMYVERCKVQKCKEKKKKKLQFHLKRFIVITSCDDNKESWFLQKR